MLLYINYRVAIEKVNSSGESWAIQRFDFDKLTPSAILEINRYLASVFEAEYGPKPLGVYICNIIELEEDK
jgi:hypothetical protein